MFLAEGYADQVKDIRYKVIKVIIDSYDPILIAGLIEKVIRR
jgi:hypothetical protein